MGDVWIWGDVIHGRLSCLSEAIIRNGLSIAVEKDCRLRVFLFHEVEEVEGINSDEVMIINPLPINTWVKMMYDIIKKDKPELIVFPSTDFFANASPQLAQSLSVSIVSNCVSISIKDKKMVFKKVLRNGKYVHVIINQEPKIVLMRCVEGAYTSEKRLPTIIKLNYDSSLPYKTLSCVHIEHLPNDPDADIVIGCGRGVGKENIEIIYQLAEILRASVAPEREVIEDGWMNGKKYIDLNVRINPRLYIGCGVSMVDNIIADCIVAIHRDVNAPIFTVADYGILGDVNLPPADSEDLRSSSPELGSRQIREAGGFVHRPPSIPPRAEALGFPVKSVKHILSIFVSQLSKTKKKNRNNTIKDQNPRT